MLLCTNCDTPVPPNEARFFGADKENNPMPHASVFVCPACFDLAMKIVERDKKQLLMLLRLQMENVRVALVQKRLSATVAPTSDRELSIKEVMEETIRLHEARENFMEEQRKNLAPT